MNGADRWIDVRSTRVLARRMAPRIAALAGCIVVYYAADWTMLCAVNRAVILRIVGTWHPVKAGPPRVISGKETHYVIVPECTYVDLLLITLPFVVGGRSAVRCVLVAAAWSACVLAAGILRTGAAILLAERDVGWFVAHDISDYVLYWPTFGATLVSRVYAEYTATRHTPTSP